MHLSPMLPRIPSSGTDEGNTFQDEPTPADQQRSPGWPYGGNLYAPAEPERDGLACETAPRSCDRAGYKHGKRRKSGIQPTR